MKYLQQIIAKVQFVRTSKNITKNTLLKNFD